MINESQFDDETNRDLENMAQAKKKIGSWACIVRNVPASLFKAGTVKEMTDYVKKLIDTCSPGGGFYLLPGAVLDNAQDKNVHTYLKLGKDHGRH